MARSRKSRWWIHALVILVLILGGLKLGRNWIAGKVLLRVAALAEKGGYALEFDDVEFALLRQHIRIEGLSLVPLNGLPSDSAARFTVKAGVIDLLGVDAWTMIRDRTLHVGHVEVRDPQVHHSFVPRSKNAARRKDGRDRKGGGGLDMIRLDTLRIINARGSSVDRTKSDTSLVVGSMDLLFTAIRIGEDPRGGAALDLGSAQLGVHGASAHLEPYYSLRLDSIHVSVPANSVAIHGMHLTPDVNAATYHREVEFQTELFEVNVDTIQLSGFDLAAELQEGAIHAGGLVISGARVDIHRDKSVPMRPDPPRKPLLAERIQGWKRSVSIDSIVMRNGRITYHERLQRGADYGSLTFAAIEGRLTGLNNTSADGGTSIHLVGDARVWDQARAQIDLVMQKADGPTRIEIGVKLRGLPATELNRMTDELVHVSATQGRIHLVEMHMKGNDVSASGTVDEQYEDLTLALSPQMKHAGVLSFLANRVVRSRNMPGDKGYRMGRFQVVRSQEKSVFNYLWIGLREGMMDVMLPEQVLKQLKKQQQKKK